MLWNRTFLYSIYRFTVDISFYARHSTSQSTIYVRTKWNVHKMEERRSYLQLQVAELSAVQVSVAWWAQEKLYHEAPTKCADNDSPANRRRLRRCRSTTGAPVGRLLSELCGVRGRAFEGDSSHAQTIVDNIGAPRVGERWYSLSALIELNCLLQPAGGDCPSITTS